MVRTGIPVADLEPLTARQLKDQAYTVIKDAITSLRFAPGATIVEAQLAYSLGISKTPIRMALVRLEHEGFVETRRASGTFVRRMSLEDVEEVFEVRLALEHCAVERLAATADACHVQTLLDSISRASGLIGDQKEAEAFQTVTEFHLQLVDLAASHWLSQTYRTLFDHIVRIGNLCGRIPGRNKTSLVEHDKIVQAIAARSSDDALRALTWHLSSVLADYRSSFGP
jgi:GntR family transcriptional regulator, rspAB operon transcriptional repressor